MGESDWGTRLQNKTKSNSSSSSNTSTSNKEKPEFGIQVLNEGFNQENSGITRYEIAEKEKNK